MSEIAQREAVLIDKYGKSLGKHISWFKDDIVHTDQFAAAAQTFLRSCIGLTVQETQLLTLYIETRLHDNEIRLKFDLIVDQDLIQEQ